MKLKLCPFCGDEPEKLEFIESVHCLNRGCGSIGPNDNKEAWNHRPLEDQLKAHAVEVLAKQLNDKENMDTWYNQELRGDTERFRAEARALLGWEE